LRGRAALLVVNAGFAWDEASIDEWLPKSLLLLTGGDGLDDWAA
jgi:hypothetical protein